jgi:hypothetical protein
MILNPLWAVGSMAGMFQDDFSHTIVNRQGRIPDIDGGMPDSVQRAISLLLKASNYAADTDRSVWEFAVTIGELLREGASENELRWLVCRGYVDHAEEVSATGNERAFDHQVSLRFGNRSAYIITSAGVAFGRDLLKDFRQSNTHADAESNSFDAPPPQTPLPRVEQSQHDSNGHSHPKWDRDRRELRLGGKLIKVFKLPSPMQEAILMAFEEENWPPRIDDPLPGHPDYPPKRRLHDTIKSLNRNQKNCLIRFMGDGTGEGIRWEMISSANVAECSSLVLGKR